MKKGNKGLKKWLYKTIVDNDMTNRVFVLSDNVYRLYLMKRSIRNIEQYIDFHDPSDEFLIVGGGKTRKYGTRFFKHYIDIEFTELGQSKLEMEAL